MKPIAALPPPEAHALTGLLFDLDDTLLTHGKLSEAAYSSLFRLQESGLLLVCVTGRPLSWGKLLVRQWPIAGAVCETGALATRAHGTQIAVRDSLPPAKRSHVRARLVDLVAEMQRRFPTLVVAFDSAERVSDATFDIGENQSADPKLVTEAVAFAEVQGARTNRSSVHLHVTFDGHDKASGTLAFLDQEFGYDPTVARRAFAYIGDSENDASAFAAFHTSIGVHNLRGRHTVPPRFLTSGAAGLGFAEAAQHLISARQR